MVEDDFVVEVLVDWVVELDFVVLVLVVVVEVERVVLVEVVVVDVERVVVVDMVVEVLVVVVEVDCVVEELRVVELEVDVEVVRVVVVDVVVGNVPSTKKSSQSLAALIMTANIPGFPIPVISESVTLIRSVTPSNTLIVEPTMLSRNVYVLPEEYVPS